MSRLRLVPTTDGSCTLYDAVLDTHYHSRFGAVSESIHVYLYASLLPERLAAGGEVRVLEIGLGTGLDFILTLQEALLYPQADIHYTAYEPNPMPLDFLQAYYAAFSPGVLTLSDELLAEVIPMCAAAAPMQRIANVTPDFLWQGWKGEPIGPFDVIYFDPFGPYRAPELWTPEVLDAAYNALAPGGRLVSFSINGATKRHLRARGYAFFRPKGYAHKRQMLVVEKPAV